MSDETKITTLEDQQGVKLPSLQGSLNQAAMTGQTLRSNHRCRSNANP